MDAEELQGSVLAATLFRLHVHIQPAIFTNPAVHAFVDELATLSLLHDWKRSAQ